MIKRVPIIFLMMAITGCQNKNKVPSGILPKKEMQALLWDIMRADKFVTDFVLRDTGLKRDPESIKLYQEILAIHSISKDKFRKSFSWYKEHPAILQVIMDSINNRVSEAPTRLATGTTTDTTAKLGESSTKDSMQKLRRRNPLRPD